MKWTEVCMFFTLVIVLTSCKHEPYLSEAPGITVPPVLRECHPDTVYFQNQILPLFQSSCAISGCHDPVTAEEDIVLNSYENIMASGELTPYDLSDGKIYENISETDPDDIMPPPPNAPLTPEQINMIATWILQGAQNNNCNGCDYPVVSFAGTVLPLIQNKCEGCHSGAEPASNTTLSTYEDVLFLVENEYLIQVLDWQTGYEPMPYNGNKLPQCEIDMIQTWINDGAPNN